MNAVETEADQQSASGSSGLTDSDLEASAESSPVESVGAGDGASSEMMTITFKLFATLQDLLPRGSIKNAVLIEVASNTTLYEIIDRHQVPRKLAHLVLVNGIFFCDADRNERGLLKPGDVLAIWPPVAGG